MPRIDALSPTKSGHGPAASREHPWHTSAVAADAAAAAEAAAAAAAAATVSCWPKHAGEGRRGVLSQTTAVPYSHASAATAGYAEEMEEERNHAAWARQRGASPAWRRHHLHQQQVRRRR